MAPRNVWDGDMPPATEERQPAPSSPDSRSPQHESNPFIAFRRLVDQQIESIFDAVMPASRYEDTPFWEQESRPSPNRKEQVPSPAPPDDRRSKFEQQRQELERKMEQEIERARQDAFKQLPWLWHAAPNKDQKPATVEHNSARRTKSEDPLNFSKPHKQHFDVPSQDLASASQNKPVQDGPDTEEQAYLFLNFPNARDQLHSPSRENSYPKSSSTSEDAGPSSFLGPLMRDLSALHQEHLLERDQTDDLLHTLREALRGVEPWERARVVDQLPAFRSEIDQKMAKAWEDSRLRDSQCPVSSRDREPNAAHEMKYGGRADRRPPVHVGNARSGEVFNNDLEGRAGARLKERQQQQQRQLEYREEPKHTISTPWWWMAAIWDPTFPRDTPSTVTFPHPRSSSRYASGSSVATPPSHSSSQTASSDPFPSSARRAPWSMLPEPRYAHEKESGKGVRGEMLTSSLKTTTSSSTQPDGTVLTRIVMEKRRADGSDERSERFFTQRPSEVDQIGGARAIDAWEDLFGHGREVKRVAAVEVEKEQRKPRRGWFWAS
ncbi:MAG: hypothetical protein M1821_002299 [Bathelium mastoideum]|nr:MAG: hypothetical protein M1821_002299 [Bathelium mastoideum]